MRQLVTIQKIKEIKPIDGADFIELATFEDIAWQCVVKKGEFTPGDLAAYFEIDGVLGNLPCYDFLGTNKRIRTRKFKSALSQGLALPLYDVLPKSDLYVDDWRVGDDLTVIASVTLYEPPVGRSGFNSGHSKGSFPSYLGISKTDETRIQSVPTVLDELRGKAYYITEKCDGTSGTFLYVDDEFMVCSRNLMLKDEGNDVYHQAANRYNLKDKLADYKHLVFQGEVVGPTIQGNKMGLLEIDVLMFNCYDLNEHRYLDMNEFIAACQKLELKTVPVMRYGNDFNYTVDELLLLAEGKYIGTKNEREGIVVRPSHEIYSERLHGRLSFKVISNKFLLKGGDD